MARDRTDVLGSLYKRGLDGDVDFLREALAVLVEGIMNAEVSVKTGAGMASALRIGSLSATDTSRRAATRELARWNCIYRSEGRELRPQSAGAGAAE